MGHVRGPWMQDGVGLRGTGAMWLRRIVGHGPPTRLEVGHTTTGAVRASESLVRVVVVLGVVGLGVRVATTVTLALETSSWTLSAVAAHVAMRRGLRISSQMLLRSHRERGLG
jgi:hypothetical protein